MKIFITGYSGFVGSHLIRRLKHNYDLCLFGRRKIDLENVEYIYGDMRLDLDAEDVMKGCEVVIHVAGLVNNTNSKKNYSLKDFRQVNAINTLNLAKQASAAGVRRFIFVSSIKVNGESTTARAPFTPFDVPEFSDSYGQSKTEAEHLLQSLSKDTGLEVVIIRPAIVYGPGVKANFAALMNLVSKGIPLPFGCLIKNKRSLVSVDNLVDLITTCIEHPKAANQVFLVSDDYDVSTSQMVREMAEALGKPTWQLPVPVWCYQLAGKLLNKSDVVDRLTGSLHVDITHTKQTLGWKPPQTLQEGFKQTADAFLQSKKCSSNS